MLLGDLARYFSVKVAAAVSTRHDYVMALTTAWTGATKKIVVSTIKIYNVFLTKM